MNKNLIFRISLVIAIIFAFTSPIMAEDINDDNFGTMDVENSIIVVDGSSYNQMTNPTIQNAIDGANSGDTILITGTEYVHCHFVVNKKLNIISEVGTKMDTCPSNTAGSGAVGLFYFGPGSEGSTLSGFTLVNPQNNNAGVGPYSVYINADNVTITNCNLETSYGPGIYVGGANNAIINNSKISNSKNGISVINSKNIQIINNNIIENSISGINIGKNVSNPYIFNNIIHANNYYGIIFSSSINAVVKNNQITENRDSKIITSYIQGAGIYVDCNITNMEIVGNYFLQNGAYGIFDSDNVLNLVNQYVQKIDNNYFVNHETRVAFHSINGQTGPIYFWSNYYSAELFCGGSAYEPGVLIGAHQRDLIIGEIKQIEKGVYSVSFIRKDTGALAKDLNSVDMTFFLNKINSNPIPSTNDIYKTVRLVNGTAIVDFRDVDYLPTNNNITVVGPGIGAIDFSPTSTRPSAFLKINDQDIPSTEGSKLVGNDLNIIYGGENYYQVTLTDFKNIPLVNKEIIFEINGVNYTAFTDVAGIAKLKINLNPGNYEIKAYFNGDDDYIATFIKNQIIITEKSSTQLETKLEGNDFIQNFGDGNYFKVILTDINNIPLANKNIKFTINGVEYIKVTDTNGKADIQINLNPGTYSVKTEFLGDSIYKYSTTTNNIFVNEIIKTGIPTYLKGEDLNQIFGENKDYTLTLTDNNGNFLSVQDIKMIINGVTYYMTSDDVGIVKIPIRLNPGTYTVSSIYEGNNLYEGNITTNTLVITAVSEKFDVKITIDNKEQTFGENKELLITLTDKNGINPIVNQNILITINGVTYDSITDNEGIAKLIIRLNPGTYDFSINYLGNSYYNSYTIQDTVKVNEITQNKTSTTLEANDLTQTFGENKIFTVVLKDSNGNPLSNQDIVFTVNGVNYIKITDSNGEAKIPIRLNPGNYQIKAEYLGNSLYLGSNTLNNLKVLKEIFVSDKLNNLQIQELINSAEIGSTLIFSGVKYDDISLNINKPLTIVGKINTTLNGVLNKAVLTINSPNVIISNFNIISKNSTGILVENSTNTQITGNKVTNSYKDTLNGHGIYLKNIENNTIRNNDISSFYSGIYMESSSNIIIENNLISKNSYGVLYGEDVLNTRIEKNDIIDSIGIITTDVVEGPLGYGIFLRDSAINVEIKDNKIVNNYIGIFIDSTNSTGIKITENLIINSTMEGLVFYKNYNFSNGAIQPLVENNAIFNNAKGPGLIIVGEVSANPEGIYAAGEFNSSLRLTLGPNWYGENAYVTWSEGGSQGPGTLCPRINTTLITFNITEIGEYSYKITFYNNGVIANLLPEFKLFFNLNYLTSKETEKEITITNGEGILNFNEENYFTENNAIYASCGSLNDVNRQFHTIFIYNI